VSPNPPGQVSPNPPGQVSSSPPGEDRPASSPIGRGGLTPLARTGIEVALLVLAGLVAIALGATVLRLRRSRAEGSP
jgi:LPXTG-motif cell wall-anchored protein